MNKNLKQLLVFALLVVVGFLVLKKCEQEPKIITETKVVYKTVVDTIKTVEIKEVPKTVYVERVKTIKGKDSIVYRDKKTDSTITANKYDATIKSNNASADLKITTTGQLLDVSGVINYKNKETTIKTTKIKPKSGLFLYGETAVNPVFERVEIGLDCQIRNTIIIGTGVSYNNQIKKVYGNVKIGIRIF